MIIRSLSYKDLHEGWAIESLSFNPDFNLLVGASGVGKTQILRAISNLKAIVIGYGFNNYMSEAMEWSLEFEFNENVYIWKGKCKLSTDRYSSKDSIKKQYNSLGINFHYEQLLANEVVLINREENTFYLNEDHHVKLNTSDSLIKLFVDENHEVKSTYKNLALIQDFYIFTKAYFNVIYLTYPTYFDSFSEVDLINYHAFNIEKIIPAYLREYDVFFFIKERFCSIFPFVEDIRLVKTFSKDVDGSNYDRYNFQIKEFDNENWIPQRSISSGMMISFLHLCAIYLSAPGSVILIDEIENSLGVNCLSDIIEDIKESEKQLQFIMTSHHPYVINNVPVEDWQIVTRKAGNINVHTAASYDIGQSKHEAFFQLIQLPAYRTGRTPDNINSEITPATL